jgi:hypothetical protein
MFFCHNLAGKKLEPLFHDPKRANEIREIGFNGCKNVNILCTLYVVICVHLIA